MERRNPLFEDELMGRREKRTRIQFTSDQLSTMEDYFIRFGPLVSRVKRLELSEQLDLSDKSVKVWFQNRRQREKREAPSSSNQPSSSRPASNQPASNRLPSNQPASNQPASNRLPSNQPASNRLPSNQPASNRPASNRLPYNQPASKQPLTNRAAFNRPPPLQPLPNRPPSFQPSSNQPSYNQPSYNQSSSNQSSYNQSASNLPPYFEPEVILLEDSSSSSNEENELNERQNNNHRPGNIQPNLMYQNFCEMNSNVQMPFVPQNNGPFASSMHMNNIPSSSSSHGGAHGFAEQIQDQGNLAAPLSNYNSLNNSTENARPRKNSCIPLKKRFRNY